jgi:hypothetical protein
MYIDLKRCYKILLYKNDIINDNLIILNETFERN